MQTGASEHLQFSLTGFSGKRVGYVVALTSFLLVPVHYYVSCEASGTVAGMSILLMALTPALCVFTPRATPHRFRPAAYALFAAVLHMLSSH
jgi:hypothetical protein